MLIEESQGAETQVQLHGHPGNRCSVKESRSGGNFLGSIFTVGSLAFLSAKTVSLLLSGAAGVLGIWNQLPGVSVPIPFRNAVREASVPKNVRYGKLADLFPCRNSVTYLRM